MLLFRFALASSSKLWKCSFSPDHPDWFHGVFVFHGPNTGISMYIDGHLRGSDFEAMNASRIENSGEVVIGRQFTLEDKHYADVTVDELYFWEEALCSAEIEVVYNWYQWDIDHRLQAEHLLPHATFRVQNQPFLRTLHLKAWMLPDDNKFCMRHWKPAARNKFCLLCKL